MRKDYEAIKIENEKLEFKFLENLCPSERENNLKKFLTYDIPMIVLTADANPPDYFFELVKRLSLIHI